MDSPVCRCGFTLLFLLAIVSSQHCNNDSDCLFGGACETNNNNMKKCNCNSNYFGSNCQYKNTENCNGDNDCRNGGDCRGNVCVCNNYWYGPTCENICPTPNDPPLCLNGGSCRADQQRDFECNCQSGFTGMFCQQVQEPECDPPCLNGGTCDVSSFPSSYSSSSLPNYCICPEGFTGPHCEEELRDCNPPCLNGGSCDMLQQSCICPSTWTGTACQDPAQPMPPCSSDSCLNGGVCINQPDMMFTCECPSNFRGPQCEEEIFPCEPNPCQNGGSCIVSQDSTTYSCNCVTGYSGATCGVQTSPCGSNPCQNGGNCIAAQDLSSYSCNCLTGFSGTTCGVIDGGGGGNGNGNPGDVSQTVIIIAAIAGGLAVLILVVVIMCIVFICCMRKKKTTQRSQKSKAKRMTQSPAITTQRHKHHSNNQPPKNYIAMTQRKTMEFPRSNLKFLQEIGSGAFATVYKAEAYGIIKPREKSIMAVKVLKENASDNDKKDFMKELSLFKSIGKHENLVRMYGCCTEKDPVYLIMEFLPKGNLQQHLRSLVNNADGSYANKMAENQLSAAELLTYGIQISKGMEFLDSKMCVHRDLAARNILLGEGFVCKISDFGLARDVADSQQYEMKSRGRVPVRWMAPESLMQNMYTTKSDAWSFGILMWEIITLGSHPYPGMSPRQVMQSVQNGDRLPQPDHCSDEMYSLLQLCWEQDPAKRPSFTQIRMSLEDMMEADQGYLQMDNFTQDNYMYLEPDALLSEELE
ncbi:uncharacterized protein [Apostichopus japonicus]|uniref:uncharacterized protein isoform X2 n=1 Tax=Stichopus japonicus TaxID=307972 RepID=UPI003AB7B76A